MPLPLPDLDTRQWSDLTDEARALIPRYAPAWTDFNVHDPGITIIDLLAWLVEQDVYWLNRVPPAHRRAFLSLIGASPRGPQAAVALLPITPPAAVEIPGGAEFAIANPSGTSDLFTTTAALTAVPSRIAAIWTQSSATARPMNMTRALSEGHPFPAFGTDPQPGAALYIGLDAPLPADRPVRLALLFAGGRSNALQRQRILDEAAAEEEDCRKPVPEVQCGPVAPSASPVSTSQPLQHPSVRTSWAFRTTGGSWQTLDPRAGEVVDDTRALTLDGAVVVRVPAAQGSWDAGSGPLYYLRVTMDSGDYDTPPVITSPLLNAAPLVQGVSPSSAFVIRPGVVLGGPEPVVPGTVKLQLSLDEDGAITALTTTAEPHRAAFMVRHYEPATATVAGELILDVVSLGRSDGTPDQQWTLPTTAVVDGSLTLSSYEGGAWHDWRIRADFAASTGHDFDATLEPTAGAITMGNGENGHIPPPRTLIFARYQATHGLAGNPGVGHSVTLATTDHNWLLFDPADFALQKAGTTAANGAGWIKRSPASYADAVARLGPLPPLRLTEAGADAESLSHAAGRVALDLQKPTRAITPADYETLAIETPGTTIARVHVLPNRVASYPCLVAPGVVTVIVVPAQQRVQPQPSAGLLRTVDRYLERRRLVGSHLAVVGPSYLIVQVKATVKLLAGASRDRVTGDVVAALNLFLHPLTGGPAAIARPARMPSAAPAALPSQGRTTPGLMVAASVPHVAQIAASSGSAPPVPPGWPFGRDVYRSEILQVISGVSGVDNVLALDLIGDGGTPQCGNLCVGPAQLVVSGNHIVEAQ